MASTKAFLDYILEQSAPLRELEYRAMMGEYILYYKGRIVGGIYDDRLLVKAVPGARTVMPGSREETPYPGAKPMLLVEETDRRGFLAQLFETMYPDLPEPKKRR